MAKVVTSEGLTEFVQEGKFNKVENHKKGNGAAPPLEVVKPPPTVDLKPLDKSEVKEPVRADPAKEPAKVADDEDLKDLTPDERELAKSERVRKLIGKKHSMLKAAEALAAQRQADADEAERFAETQFNEKTLFQKRAEAAEARAAELEGKIPKEVPAAEKKAPIAADFTNAQGQVDWDAYTDAKANFAAEQAVEKERQRQAKEKADAEIVVRTAQLKAQTEAAREKHPDFDRVLSAAQGTAADQVPQFVLNYLWESDASAELVYYLAKHPEESQRIGKLKPIRGVAELGKLEDQLTKSQTPPTASAATPVRSERSGAPAPITPLEGDGTGTGINTDPSTMGFKELRAYHRQKAREKRSH
jgi:hypothetical protein